jgi:type II secretory pathway component PulC
MERRKYHYRVRPYSRQNSVIWRWFVFEDRRAIESGIVTEPNRSKAEAAAQAAIERLSQEQFFGQVALSVPLSQEPRPEAGKPEAI